MKVFISSTFISESGRFRLFSFMHYLYFYRYCWNFPTLSPENRDWRFNGFLGCMAGCSSLWSVLEGKLEDNWGLPWWFWVHHHLDIVRLRSHCLTVSQPAPANAVHQRIVMCAWKEQYLRSMWFSWKYLFVACSLWSWIAKKYPVTTSWAFISLPPTWSIPGIASWSRSS